MKEQTVNDIHENRKVVSLVLDNDTPDSRKEFNCPRCKSYVFSYYNELKIMIFGRSEVHQRKLDVTCPKCKVVYQIC